MSVDQINIEHLPQHIGKSVTLKGWVSNKREGKGIAFIVLRDGTGYCQCVVTGDNSGLEQLETAQSTSLETSVIIQGLVKSDDKQIGGIEVEVSEISYCRKQHRLPHFQKRTWRRIPDG
jgi:asparaginyl-tRNA synthetase